MLTRGAGALAAGGGLVSVAASGWPALLVVAALTGLTVIAACWVLNDQDRTKRLALLIRAWRGPTQRPRGAAGARRTTGTRGAR